MVEEERKEKRRRIIKQTCFLYSICQNSLQMNLMTSSVSWNRWWSIVYLMVVSWRCGGCGVVSRISHLSERMEKMHGSESREHGLGDMW